MLHAKKKWKLSKPPEDKVEMLASAVNISPFLAQLLVNRGITTPAEAESFLHIRESDLFDPFLLDQMDIAVKRIERAIDEGEPILIYGDYDADGVNSTVILFETLKELGALVDYYIPDRFKEGYGPNKQAFQRAKEEDFHVIITVDNGIAAVDVAAFAKEIGLDLIITDHHQIGDQLPDAYAIIHPQCSPNYPFSDLCGAGVAFKLAHALYKKIPTHLLEYAAIGTVCDLVPLQGENRAIVKLGLKRLQQTKKIGLKALMDVAQVDVPNCNEYDIGFGIGPRINAVGRLQSAMLAVELLTSENVEEAKQMAIQIDELNQERQELVKQITEEAMEMVKNESDEEDEILILAKEGWNVGVIGIVASRLVETFYKPVIMLTIDHEKNIAKGSARSIEGFHLFQELSKCKDLLPHFGGHAQAAGMTLPLENLEELQIRLKQYAKICFTEHERIPTIQIDATVSVSEVDLSLIQDVQKLAPFGMNNAFPTVLIENASIAEKRQIGAQKNHLKLLLQEENKKLDAVGFQFGDQWHNLSEQSPVSLVGELSINEWNGHRKPQMIIQDLAVKEWQLFDIRNQKNVAEVIQRLPQQTTVCIAFQEETVTLFQATNDATLLFYPTIEEEMLPYSHVVFLDLPSSLHELQHVLQKIERPERIYTVFYHRESYLFTPLPTKKEFSSYYKWLRMQKQVSFAVAVKQIERYKNWTKEKLTFMTKVFFELGFVKIESGIIFIHPSPEKKQIESAPIYQKRLNQIKVEQQLAYATYQQLKEWFEKNIRNE